MIVRPRPGFEPVLKAIDAVNPVLVILSIVGLFLEYTPVKAWVTPVNQVLDVIFVVDFGVRLVCYPPVRYFVHGYGWVDFLASLPGLVLLLSYTPMFAIFKFVRIGRFFKIIRVLRFLRIFGFLKRMKSESPWIQDRIMKIGIAIVLVFMTGIFFLDSGLKTVLDQTKVDQWARVWTATNHDPQTFTAPGVVMYAKDGRLFRADGAATTEDAWDALANDDSRWYVEVALPGGNQRLLVLGDELTGFHDGLMLVLLSTLVGLLFIVIFYLGAVFAQDMRPVHLIIDSLEAGDDQLLQQEARALDPELEVHPDENEMTSLLKVVARVSGTGSPGSFDLGGGFVPPRATGDTAELLDRLDRIEAKIEESTKQTVMETVKFIAPAIIKYVRKETPKA